MLQRGTTSTAHLAATTATTQFKTPNCFSQLARPSPLPRDALLQMDGNLAPAQSNTCSKHFMQRNNERAHQLSIPMSTRETLVDNQPRSIHGRVRSCRRSCRNPSPKGPSSRNLRASQDELYATLSRSSNVCLLQRLGMVVGRSWKSGTCCEAECFCTRRSSLKPVVSTAGQEAGSEDDGKVYYWNR